MTTSRSIKQIATAVDNLLRLRTAGLEPTVRERNQALADVAVADVYGLDLQAGLVHRRRNIPFSPKDRDGRRVKVLQKDNLPFRSWSRSLQNTDIHLYVLVHRDVAEVCGWLPERRIQEAPQYWWYENNIKTDFAYELSVAVLNPPPKEFRFVEPCPHVYVSEEMSGAYGGIWRDIPEVWECFGCGRSVDDRRTRESLATDYRGRHSVPAEEEAA